METFFGKQGFVWWQGVVEDIGDPLKLGRCRVRIFGFHVPDKNKIKTEDLPWAYPVQPITSAALCGIGDSPTGLLPGSHVFGFFRDGDDSQQPVMLGSIPGIPQTPSNPNEGFGDPSGILPFETLKHGHSQVGEQDVSRLARNENVNDTAIGKKAQDTYYQGVPTANSSGGNWNEPPSPYFAIYPFNHVKETLSGHIQEFDDTPGAERIHTYHKSGTFNEVHPEGTEVHKVVSNKYELIAGDEYVHVRGNVNLIVGGKGEGEQDSNITILVRGNAGLQVDGNVFGNVKGDATLQIEKNLNAEVKSNMTIGVKGSTVINTAGDTEITSKGKLKLSGDAGVELTSSMGEVNMNSATASVNITAATTAMFQTISGGIEIMAQGAASTGKWDASGIKFNAASIDLN